MPKLNLGRFTGSRLGQRELYANAYLRILENPKIDPQLKWFCILQLMHDEAISIHKAHEIAVEVGLLTRTYIELDAQLTKGWFRYFGRED